MSVALASKQIAINATTANSVVVVANPTRRSLYIRNYTASGATMWVAFNQVATAGTKGELEIVAGNEYSWSGPLASPTNEYTPANSFYMGPACPIGSVNVITSSSTATGCVLEQ